MERRRQEGDGSRVAQKRVLSGKEEPKHQLQSRPKQIMDNLKTKKGSLDSNPPEQEPLSSNETRAKLAGAQQQGSSELQGQQGGRARQQQQGKQQQGFPATQQPVQQSATLDPLYQYGQQYGNGSHYQQVERVFCVLCPQSKNFSFDPPLNALN